MEQSPHKRAQAAKKAVADIIEQALKISFPTQDGPTRVTRDGDSSIRVRHQGLEDHAPVYTQVNIVGQA